MKICSICNKISASGQDHLDCKEKRKIELQDEDFKQKITEKLDLSINPQDLSVEIRAILEHIIRKKDESD